MNNLKLNSNLSQVFLKNDIFCEKITDCFATGTIPIFWGTKNIGNYFDKEGIIFLENIEEKELSADLYFSKIKSKNEK